MLEAAVVAGLTSAGADGAARRRLPTPALAFLTAAHDADLGVMISASHNPMPDNGIKLFSRGGHKLPDAVEAAIERTVVVRRRRDDHRPDRRRRSAACRTCPTRSTDYVGHLLGTRRPAAARAARSSSTAPTAPPPTIAPEVYRRAGATVHAIGDEPDGWNINDGIGSTHLEPADRGRPRARAPTSASPTTATPTGASPSPPRATWSTATRSWRSARWRCTSGAGSRDDTVVATVMSNLGFHHTMRDAGIAVQTTAVGDRYVLEALRGRRPEPGRRAERPPGLPRPRDHRRRPAHRPALLSRMTATGRLAGRAGRRSSSGCRRSLVNVPVARPAGGRRERRGRRGGQRRRGGARRRRARAAAPVGHRAAGAGDGRGAHPGPGRRDRRTASPQVVAAVG